MGEEPLEIARPLSHFCLYRVSRVEPLEDGCCVSYFCLDRGLHFEPLEGQ
jgi:hypothetical protein